MGASRARVFLALAFVVGASGACGGSGATQDGAAPKKDAATADAPVDAGGCHAATASCTNNAEGFLLCTDYAYADVTTFEAECTAGNNTWATAPCDRTGAVQGCRVIQPAGCTTTWYGDSLEVEQVCVGSGMEVVGP